MDGYIKLFRQVQDNPMYFDGKFDKVHAWIDILMLASWKDTSVIVRGIKVDVKRGQIAKGIRFFCERWKWSQHTVEKFFKELEDATQIATQKSNVINLISVINYDKYQICECEDATQNATQNATQIKKVSPITPLQENKKESKRKKSSYSKEYSDEEISSPLYQEFLRFSEWLNSNCERLSSLKKQMTFENYSSIRSEHSKEELFYVCTRADDWKNLAKNRVSVYLVLLDRFVRYKDDMIKAGITQVIKQHTNDVSY